MSVPAKISVIIPTYGATRYLEECLLSVSGQLISADGYSFDILLGIDHCNESLSVVKSVMHRYSNLRVFYFNENLGPYIVRNTLATISGADYLVFFDSDDIMPQDFLQSLVEPLLKYDIVRFGCVNFIEVQDEANGTIRVTDKKQVKAFRKSLPIQQAVEVGVPYHLRLMNSLKNKRIFKSRYYVKFIKKLLHMDRSIAGVFAIKRAVFLDMNGYKPWPIASDAEFINRAILKKRKIFILPESKSFMRRIHLDNLTSDHLVGMGSKVRNDYSMMIRSSVYENEPIKITSNYVLVGNPIP